MQQGPGASNWRALRHPVRRRLRAVRGAKGVHHKHIAERRIVSGQVARVGSLSRVETHVLQQHNVARQRCRSAPLSGQQHIAPEEIGQMLRDGCE